MGSYQLKRCTDCNNLYDPVFDTVTLCHSCFMLEDGCSGQEEQDEGK